MCIKFMSWFCSKVTLNDAKSTWKFVQFFPVWAFGMNSEWRITLSLNRIVFYRKNPLIKQIEHSNLGTKSNVFSFSLSLFLSVWEGYRMAFVCRTFGHTAIDMTKLNGCFSQNTMWLGLPQSIFEEFSTCRSQTLTLTANE